MVMGVHKFTIKILKITEQVEVEVLASSYAEAREKIMQDMVIQKWEKLEPHKFQYISHPVYKSQERKDLEIKTK